MVKIIEGTENEKEASTFTITEDQDKNAKISCTTGLYFFFIRENLILFWNRNNIFLLRPWIPNQLLSRIDYLDNDGNKKLNKQDSRHLSPKVPKIYSEKLKKTLGNPRNSKDLAGSPRNVEEIRGTLGNPKQL